MSELWDKFIFEFCKVDFFCWHGGPNWLGWILLEIAGFLSFMICFFLFLNNRRTLDDLGRKK